MEDYLCEILTAAVVLLLIALIAGALWAAGLLPL